MASALPSHLKKYIVEQHYEKYTAIDQAVWRFIMRQLKAYLSKHAHECYLEGLQKTGIEIERIPKISEINKKLNQFGWRALPVSGFIPPAAFMELQSLSILPIASDMRSLDHLLYTPAPDIVHEAAGHAPILIHPEFAAYLKKYAQVAKKAIISREDLELYEAIRYLSDLKENPTSTTSEIKRAEEHLAQVSKKISHVSEASLLGRMNWWTAEYGLIGSLDKPKIFGAGLLSSVGESRWCLSEKVKKIPLTLDCINTSYDITEPQPQLFVTPDFKKLGDVLEEMANTMAFRRGGEDSLQKAIQAESVNSAELNSGLQISGVWSEIIMDSNKQMVYLRTSGPTQLCYQDKELPNHSKLYHKEGYSFPIGHIQGSSICPSQWSHQQWKDIGIEFEPFKHDGALKALNPKSVQLHFSSGVKVHGNPVSCFHQNNKTLLITFKDCKVTYKDRVLFEPNWGNYDMALGTSVPSVFGGAADREAYGETKDFIAARVPSSQFSAQERQRQELYQSLRDLREQQVQGAELTKELDHLFHAYQKQFPKDWLLIVEMYELAIHRKLPTAYQNIYKQELLKLKNSLSSASEVIMDGLSLAETFPLEQ